MIKTEYRRAFLLTIYSVLISVGLTLLSYLYFKVVHTAGILWTTWQRGFPFPYAWGIYQGNHAIFTIGVIDFLALFLDFLIFLLPATGVVLVIHRRISYS